MKLVHALLPALTVLAACDKDEAASDTASAEPTPKTSAAATSKPQRRRGDPLAPAKAPESEKPKGDEPTGDCAALCKTFTKKRAECVDEFVAHLTMPPDMLAKVKDNHKKNADGRECSGSTGLCPRDTGAYEEASAKIRDKTKAWGKCAEEAKDCKSFVDCYKKANE